MTRNILLVNFVIVNFWLVICQIMLDLKQKFLLNARTCLHQFFVKLSSQRRDKELSHFVCYFNILTGVLFAMNKVKGESRNSSENEIDTQWGQKAP